jgi:hypothetical protein
MPKLEFDPALIKNLALVHEASAALHSKRAAEQQGAQEAPERSRWSQHEMLAASGLVIAASYWSLIEPRRAVQLYRRASEAYRHHGHSYAMVLALASASRNEIPAMVSAIEAASAPNPQAVAFAMVANEVTGDDRPARRIESLDVHWRHVGNMPVGRLSIPLDHYGVCAQAMRAAHRDEDIERFFAAATDYVQRAAEVIRSASHDRYHWLQLRSAILPAEPEAVAMTTAMSMTSHSVFKMPISEMANLDVHGRLLVELGDEMRNAAIGEEPRAG